MNVFEEVKKAIIKIQPGIDESKITPAGSLERRSRDRFTQQSRNGAALEDTLDLTLQDAELEDIKTVKQVLDFIESRLKVRNA